MDAVTLEGFLTAIAIGPVTVTPEHWLPQVFGSDPEDAIALGAHYLAAAKNNGHPLAALGHFDLPKLK